MSRSYYRGVSTTPPSIYASRAGGYWGQVAAMRAQAKRPIVRYRAAVVTVAEPLVAATIVLLVCGLVAGRAIFLNVAFGLSLAITLLVLVTLVASASAAATRSWQHGDGR